jgi:putative oxidoreductase
MKAPFVIGRIVFGAFFLNSGINHFRHREEMKRYVESKGVPAPKFMVMFSAVPLLVGGTSLILGIKPKLGALAVLGFLSGASPIMKNMALAGAALALMSTEQPNIKVPRVSQPSLVDAVRDITSEIAA